MTEGTSSRQGYGGSKLRRVFLLSGLALSVVFALFVWYGAKRHSHSNVEPQKVTRSPGHGSNNAQSKPATDKGKLQGSQSPTSARPSNIGRSDFKVSQEEVHGEDSFRKGLWGFALSGEEARWMDRQGMPAPSQLGGAYDNMDLGELLRLASAGDLVAARIGASRARNQMWQEGVGLRISQLSRPALPPGHQYQPPSEADRSRLVELMGELWRSRDWELFHEFLWQGVVNGSSYAASEMSKAYWDASMTCYEPVLCGAWQLVAWRMGNWEVSSSGPAIDEHVDVPLAAILARADLLWLRVNKARADRGMPPLQIDLRPNYVEWQNWRRHPEETKTIYRP